MPVVPLFLDFRKGGAKLHPLFQNLKKAVQFWKSVTVREILDF
jgi:hypothetical protein